jgi:hypothetical protein
MMAARLTPLAAERAKLQAKVTDGEVSLEVPSPPTGALVNLSSGIAALQVGVVHAYHRPIAVAHREIASGTFCDKG